MPQWVGFCAGRWTSSTEARRQYVTRMFIRHSVADYGAWRKVYDALDSERKPMGVTGAAVFRGTDDENDITVWHDFTTVDEAKAFAVWPRLKAAMDEAGVTNAPSIWFVNEA